MRHNLLRQRISMKHTLTRSALALIVSLAVLPTTHAVSKAQQWDYLHPTATK